MLCWNLRMLRMVTYRVGSLALNVVTKSIFCLLLPLLLFFLFFILFLLWIWFTCLIVFHPDIAAKIPPNAISGTRVRSVFANELLKADWVPPSLPPHRGLARLLVCEDNEATIHLLIKGRKKYSKNARFPTYRLMLMERWTDGPTDGQSLSRN